MTLKKALLRGLLGAPLGVFISYTITIVISIIIGEELYSPAVPALIQTAGNEMNAVVLQYILSALLGFAFAIGSAVYQVDEWSITKQTFIHAIISISSMLPIAYFCCWMQHTVWGILSYIIIFIVLYVIIWLIQINLWKKRIKAINKGIQDLEQ